jgi:hypothetical protein
MTKMEKEFEKIMEAANGDLAIIRMLKHVAVRSKAYHLASELRQKEREIEDSNPEIKLAHERATAVKTVLAMAGFSVEEPTAWVIDTVISEWDRKKDFSLSDAAVIKQRSHAFFGE